MPHVVAAPYGDDAHVVAQLQDGDEDVRDGGCVDWRQGREAHVDEDDDVAGAWEVVPHVVAAPYGDDAHVFVQLQVNHCDYRHDHQVYWRLWQHPYEDGNIYNGCSWEPMPHVIDSNKDNDDHEWVQEAVALAIQDKPQHKVDWELKILSTRLLACRHNHSLPRQASFHHHNVRP